MFEINGRRFYWDEDKYKSNVRKHGVKFTEAASVFFDPSALFIYDSDHSYYEERFVAIGMSKKLRLLFVCHCDRDYDGSVRIISARKATKREAKLWENELRRCLK